MELEVELAKAEKRGEGLAASVEELKAAFEELSSWETSIRLPLRSSDRNKMSI